MTLAKIQVTAIFLMGDMRRNVFPRFIEICMETPCWCHGGRKPAETSVTEFCYKSVNLSLEELKNVTIILYSNSRTVQRAEFPEIGHFFNRQHSSLVRQVKGHVTQKFRNSSVVYR